MLGPDSKAAGASGMPACLVQPSPSATKICATPITGMKPTRSGCWASAPPVADASKPATKRDTRMRIGFLNPCDKLLSRRTIYDLRPIHPANGLPYCNARERKSFRYCLPGSSNLLADLGHLDLRPCPHPVQRLHVGERRGEDIARACKPLLIALADPRAAEPRRHPVALSPLYNPALGPHPPPP